MTTQYESQLLAELGSTAALAADYETSVLRNAQQRLAPQIVLPTFASFNNDNSVQLSSTVLSSKVERPSMPDLSSLAPSAASKKRRSGAIAVASADIPHVLTVLSHTRDTLISTLSESLNSYQGNTVEEKGKARRRQIDLLRMKEQILLTYLTDVAGLDEHDDVIPQRGNKRKNIRRNSSTSDEYYGNVNHKKEGNRDSSIEQSFRGEKNEIKSIEPCSSDRLDRIKNGEEPNQKNCYSSTKIENTAGGLHPKRLKRNTMMKMKSQIRLENGLSPLKTMMEEKFNIEHARKRQEERIKRRFVAKRASLEDVRTMEAELETMEKECSAKRSILKNKLSNDVLQVESDKTCFTNERNVAFLIEDEEIDQQPHNHENLPTSATIPDGIEKSHTKVFCPVCQIILTMYKDEELSSPDEFLSRHIDECQKKSQIRSNHRTLRKRKNPAIIEVGEDFEEEDYFKETNDETSSFTEKDSVDNQRKCDKYPLCTDNHVAREKYVSKSIDDIDELDYEDRVDYWIENGLQRMKDMSERDASESPPGAVVYEGGLEIPAWVNDRLFPYQRTGVRWMWELFCQGAGGVVGDEMGLGKTVQVSAFLGTMAANRFLDSVLIISPATMLTHWLTELSIWAPGLRRVMVHRSGESDGVSRNVSKSMLTDLQKWLKNARADRVNEAIDDKDYNDNEPHSFCGTGYAIVTTYEGIRRSTDLWTNHDWSYVVLDEGQKIRNPDADVTLACKRLRTFNRILMSGTPIQNDLRELWSLFDFVFPGRLGTLPAFEAEFAEPIKRGGYSNASPMQVQLAYRCALVLRDLINPYLLRRQKKDVEEVNRMPPKTEQVLFCRLSKIQRALYEEYLKSDAVMGVLRGSFQLLKAVTVLRKICNHPDLVSRRGDTLESLCFDESSFDDDDRFYEEDEWVERSGKLQVLSKILPLWHQQGHRVIIFCQWRKMLNIIEQFIIQNGWTYARLDGNTNVASRQKLVDNFNQDTCYFCMLMTTRTGGVGLNVTGANRVILYDPDWNPQTDAQARERSWRFGQKKNVTVYRLITAGTIEEKIYQRQIFKTALSNQILQDPKQRRLFSQNDLRDLFTLKDDCNDTTETGEITRKHGAVEVTNSEPISSRRTSIDSDDHGETLELVMKNRGLCGVFDHDFVEKSSVKKPMFLAQMEESARKVALKAALSLKASTLHQDRFVPTWTGSDETKLGMKDRPHADASFGGANFAGMNSNSGCEKMTSSMAILASLRNKKFQITSSTQQAIPTHDSVQQEKNHDLMLRLQNYIKCMNATGSGPTTRDLLDEFKDVPDSDAAIFRSMLKLVAVSKNGRWIMR